MVSAGILGPASLFANEGDQAWRTYEEVFVKTAPSKISKKPLNQKLLSKSINGARSVIALNPEKSPNHANQIAGKQMKSKKINGKSIINSKSMYIIVLSTVVVTVFSFSKCGINRSAKLMAGQERSFEIAPNVNIVMCWIPPGEFEMGSPPEELGHEQSEKQHHVKILNGFWMAKTETTQAQWLAGGGEDTTWRPPAIGDNKILWNWEQVAHGHGEPLSAYKGSSLPAERMDWQEANKWCEELSKTARAAGRLPDGWTYSLPTEAEWEYACRAGTRTSLNNGHDIDVEHGECEKLNVVGWYDRNSGHHTNPVGQKKPNAWGLFDMHGNVREWCAGWYKEDDSNDTTTDPFGASEGSEGILRGGSWVFPAKDNRAACRQNGDRTGYSFDLGFRPVLRPLN